MDETEYLLQSKANSEFLLESLAQVEAGEVITVNLDDYIELKTGNE